MPRGAAGWRGLLAVTATYVAFLLHAIRRHPVPAVGMDDQPGIVGCLGRVFRNGLRRAARAQGTGPTGLVCAA